MGRKKTPPIDIRDIPAYSIEEVSNFVQIPRTTIKYWIASNGHPPVIHSPSVTPPRLSFNNLVEFHILSAIRVKGVKLQNIRMAISSLATKWPAHPLLHAVLSTDGVDIFSEALPGDLVNESLGGQGAFRELLEIYLERIEWDSQRFPITLYPFVKEHTHTEPRWIQIDPRIAFGKPVIAGTGISTSVVADRFNARESVSSLASEYARAVQEIEEAIRWEQTKAA